jgi:hypothetical protein
MSAPKKPALHLQLVWMVLEGGEAALPPQAEHAPALDAAYLPAGQAVQVALPASANVPAEQGSHDDVASLCFLPAAQGWRGWCTNVQQLSQSTAERSPTGTIGTPSLLEASRKTREKPTSSASMQQQARGAANHRASQLRVGSSASAEVASNASAFGDDVKGCSGSGGICSGGAICA